MKGAAKASFVPDKKVKKEKKAKKEKKSKDKKKRKEKVEDIVVPKPIIVETKTAAEIRFAEFKKKMRFRTIDGKKQVAQSHRDKMKEYNAKLENQPVHYDIPKVGPG